MKFSTVYKDIKNYIINYKKSKKYAKNQIEKNKIIFWSYRGKSYSCNPKYISEYILNNNNIYNMEIVWAFNNINEYKWMEKYGIKVVEYYSSEFFKELMTSHFIITNTRFGMDFHKRNGQIYIQTWHGTMALKTIEKDAEKTLNKYYLLNAKNDSKKTDYIISGCKMNSDIIKNAFWYNGKILECGNPRNDLFFDNKKCKEIISSKYNINDKSIILYAPTFRSNGDLSVYDIDFNMVLKIASEKFNRNFAILTRLHPNLKGNNIFKDYNENIIDVTDYDDMQELLSASDILITDFSSSMFDFCIMKKICFLYASDFDNYLKNERALYFDIKKDLPFPLATNNEKLLEIIKNFNENTYYKNLEKFNKKLDIVEDGNASKKIVELILKLK